MPRTGRGVQQNGLQKNGIEQNGGQRRDKAGGIGKKLREDRGKRLGGRVGDGKGFTKKGGGWKRGKNLEKAKRRGKEKSLGYRLQLLKGKK